MRKVTQLFVTLENKPGSLAHFSQVLFEAGINIQALTATGSGPKIIVDNTEKAKSVLKQKGISFTAREVLAIELANKPGEIARLAKKIAEAGINIDYIYGTASPADPKGYFILEVAEVEKIRKMLQ